MILLTNLVCLSFLQSLIEAHDDIAAQNFEELTDVVPVFAPPTQIMHSSPTTNNPIRMVGIRKSPEEPLVSICIKLLFLNFLLACI